MRFGLNLVIFILAFCLSTAHADETLDFFRQFLDKSPSSVKAPVSETVTTSDDPIVETVRVAQNTKSPTVVTRQTASPTPAPPIAKPSAPKLSVPKPGVPQRIADPVHSRKVADEDVSSIYADAVSKTTTITPEQAQEAKQMEQRVNRQIGDLQNQLEREEKLLQKKISEYSRRREAALEKSDEAALKRIEQLEKAAVTSYEKRIETLIARASNPNGGYAATQTPNRRRGVSPETQPPATKTLAVQQPVANRRPYANGQTATQTATQQKRSTLQQRQAAQKPLPSWARNRTTGTPSQQSAQRRAYSQTSKPEQAKPKKRRFKLWPFK